MRWRSTREMLLGCRAYSFRNLLPCGLLPPLGLSFGLQVVGDNANAINGATTETKLVPAARASVLSEGKRFFAHVWLILFQNSYTSQQFFHLQGASTCLEKYKNATAAS